MLDFGKYKSAETALRFFEEFSRIPHGSSNTSMIADYLVDFAKARGLWYNRDEFDNVIIKKNAAPGYEGKPTVIFQGHIDMVAEKLSSSTKDMTKDGLDLYIDGEFLRAKDTTLGADDGVAIAYALAVLDGACPHPDFEAVFTSDEEIGLIGASNINPELIKGRLLINIDSDEEGIFTVGCAGGMRSDIDMPVEYEKDNGKRLSVKISGLAGGHSGIEIDKGRLNANKLLGALLRTLPDARIESIEGGNADNAIPREAQCVIALTDEIEFSIANAAEKLINEAKSIEKDIKIEYSPCESKGMILNGESSAAVIALLCELPSGVIAMSSDIEGLVETSLNLGILRLGEKTLSASFSVRSAKGKEKQRVGDMLSEIAVRYGATYSERGAYPAWEYRKDSHLRDCMVNVYEKMYGSSPKVVTIHAGLECGIFSDMIPELDCVSIGPDNFDIHTTEEHLSLPSFERTWEFLKQVLREI